MSIDNSPPRESVRLQKFLASAGYGSRRHCEEFIQSGRVTVDGREVRELGTTVDPSRQMVRVDGEIVRVEPKRYYLLNKPLGVVCTHRDPAGRPRAVDLVRADGVRLFTVGRLDENSTGLLLVTNDGELAHRLAHPRFQIERTYRVQVAGIVERDTLAQLRRGLRFRDGLYRVRSVKRLSTRGKSTVLKLVLTEGKNREIRRLLARLNHKVQRLERIGFGPLRLGGLESGAFRPLNRRELNELRALVSTPPRRRRSVKKGAASRKKVAP